jgi:YHS domain-containing protein
MRIDPSAAAASREHRGAVYYFCSVRCAEKFDADADAYIAASRLPEVREEVRPPAPEAARAPIDGRDAGTSPA